MCLLHAKEREVTQRRRGLPQASPLFDGMANRHSSFARKYKKVLSTEEAGSAHLNRFRVAIGEGFGIKTQMATRVRKGVEAAMSVSAE